MPGKNKLTIEGEFFDRKGTIEMDYDGEDSVLVTLKEAIGQHLPGIDIQNYYSNSIGNGSHALSVSTITLVDQNHKEYKGVGEARNIGISALKALVNAANEIYIEQNYKR